MAGKAWRMYDPEQLSTNAQVSVKHQEGAQRGRPLGVECHEGEYTVWIVKLYSRHPTQSFLLSCHLRSCVLPSYLPCNRMNFRFLTISPL